MNIIVKFVKNYLKEFSDACMGYVGIIAEEICIRQMKKIKPTDEELHQHNTFTRVKGQPIKWEKISAKELISEIHKDFLLLLLSHFSHVRLCVTPWTAAYQAPLALGFSRQEHWSGLPFPSPMHESEK